MESDKNPMWIKVLVLVFLTLLLMGFIGSSFAYYEPVINYTDDNFPLVVIPKVNGFIKPDTQFEYQFIFATDENCVDDVYTTTKYLTTDKYGVASTTVDLSGITEIPSYLCEYRDGSLRKVHTLNERLFMKQITEQDIIDYGFIKNYIDTKLNDSDIGNLGYIKNYTETDPSVTLQKLQNLTINDFHNLGGIDRVLNKSEIETMGFLLNQTDYCENGVCDGDLTITGDLSIIGTLNNVNATNINTNGSIIPDFDNIFDLGSTTNKWNNIYGNNIYGNIDYSQLQNVPSFLLTETDPKIFSTTNNRWCRGSGTQIVCDIIPFVDTKLNDNDISNFGYIKTYTETDPLFIISPSSTITLTDISNWISAYNWGNHQNYGYITNPNDAVDSNELDNLCNQNGMILKRINNTWGCSDDIGFIPTNLLTDYNFSDNSINWDNVYNDYYNNTNGYLTSYTETDPIFIGSPSYNINTSEISNWNLAYNWGNHNIQGYLKNETDPIFTSSASYGISSSNISNWNLAYNWGNHNNVGYLTTETDPLFTTSPSSNISNIDISNWDTSYSWGNHQLEGYLKNYTETDPLYISDKNGIVFYIDTTNWDKNITDDFNGNWNNLNAIPIGFLDGIDNDTKYYNLSEFINDVGFLTSFSETDPIYISEKGNIIFMNDTLLWDKDYSDDFDGNWSSLQSIPSEFLDGVDNDTKYYNLSEFINDVGYITSYIDTRLNESQVDDFVSNNGYLTSYNETDPIWNNEKLNYVLISSTSNWDKNVSDDFDGNYNNLYNTPNNLSEFLNDVGYITSYIDTTYENLSEFNNDVGYLTSFNETDPIYISERNGIIFISDTSNWDKNVSDDFDGNWISLSNIPVGFIDGIDNDTKYYNLSEFINDVGYITSYIDTTLNESEVDAFVSNNGYLTSYTETDPIFVSSPSFNINTSDISNWNLVYSWGNHNNMGYLTSFNETDPLFIGSPSYGITNTLIGNWNNVYNDYYNNTNGYLTSYTETDPFYINDKSNIVFFSNTTNWDKNVNDDFDYQWNSLLNVPTGFLDGIDNDTKYYNLSEFVNDVGYLTNFNELDPMFTSSVSYGINQSMIDNWNYVFNQINSGGNSSVVFEDDTILWDKDYTDDFDYQWSSLLNIPVGFSDGVDNDTKYYNLSEFNNNVGYLTSFNETDPLFTTSPSYNILNSNISNWNEAFSWGNHNNMGYLTELDIENITINNENVIENINTFNPEYVNVVDEFLGGSTEDGEIGNLGWNVNYDNSASSRFNDKGDETDNKNAGVLLCRADVDKDSGCTFSLWETIRLKGNEHLGFVIYSGNTDYSNYKLGLQEEISKPKDTTKYGIYFRYDDFSSTIIGVSRNNDVETTCDTNVINQDNTWYQLEIKVNSAKDRVDYYINEQLRCSITTNIPQVNIGPQMSFYLNSDISNKDYVGYVDLFWLNYKTGQRWD